MITTVICDLDGLLADTERLHLEAYREILGRHGFDLTDEEYAAWWIRDGSGIGDYVVSKQLSLDPAEIRMEKTAFYDELVSSVAGPMPGAHALLNRLSPHKHFALATSSYEQSARLALKRLRITHYFEVIATRESARRVKPDPGVFLFAASELNLPPSECLVLEDSQKGVLAAASAGMKCIAIPNQYTKDNDFSRATVVVSSLDEVTLELIDSLG